MEQLPNRDRACRTMVCERVVVDSVYPVTLVRAAVN
jgi:hypothetical protein